MALRLCIFTTKIKNNKRDGRKLWEMMGMSMALVVIVSYVYILGIFHILDLSPSMENMISIATKNKLHIPPMCNKNINVKITFQVLAPSPSSPRFKDLLTEMTDRQEELGIASFGISITTMEEVFIK